jgi:hypothetical protein
MNAFFYWRLAFFYWYIFILSLLLVSFIEFWIDLSEIDLLFYLFIYALLVLITFTLHDSRVLRMSVNMTFRFYTIKFLSPKERIVPAFHSKILHLRVQSWIIQQDFLFVNTLKLSDISIFYGLEKIFDEYIPIHQYDSKAVYPILLNFLNISFGISYNLIKIFKNFREYFRNKQYDLECQICIEVLESKVTACGHCFCPNCLSNMKNCAICRSEIDKSKNRSVRDAIIAKIPIYR